MLPVTAMVTEALGRQYFEYVATGAPQAASYGAIGRVAGLHAPTSGRIAQQATPGLSHWNPGSRGTTGWAAEPRWMTRPRSHAA